MQIADERMPFDNLYLSADLKFRENVRRWRAGLIFRFFVEREVLIVVGQPFQSGHRVL